MANGEVARQLAEKLRLEAEFSPKVKRLLTRIARDAGKGYRETGIVPAVGSAYLSEWRQLLQTHYAVVGKRFGGMAVPVDGDEWIAEAALEFARFTRRQSVAQAAAISETNQEEATAVFTAAAAEIIAQTPNIGSVAQSAIAIIGQRRLTQAYVARVETIALTETQAAAEARKLIDVQASTRLPPPRPAETLPVAAPKAVKTWRTVGDGKVRDTHAAANGQTVDADAHFIVAGEKLEYPGDRWSGASLKNVIRCRCTAIYSVQ